MNLLKAKLVTQRIGRELRAAMERCKADVDARFHFDSSDYDEHATSQAYDELQRELDHFCIDNDQHNLSIGYRDAEALAMAAALRVHGDAPQELAPLEVAGITYLAMMLGCDMPAMTSATVEMTFVSPTVTYEGDMDDFRTEFRVGANIAWDSQVPFRVLEARIADLQFQPRDNDSGSLLRTCTVSGKLALQVELVSDTMTLEERLKDMCVTLGHPMMQSRQLAPKEVLILNRTVS